jgi:hypothetical protein
MKKISLIIYIFAYYITAASADNIRVDSLNNNEWEYELNCGINLGGAAPLSIPREIRSINSYNPRFNGVIGADITRWLNKYSHWRLSVGLLIESKSMHTGATVKSYHTEVSYDDNSKVSGYWTGYVNTKYSTTLVNIPILANYRLDNRWKFRAGFYLSYAIYRDFSGYVTDGYLRQNTPVGQKMLFTEGKRGTYDFSDNLRRLQPGLQIGASWMNKKHLCVNADMSLGMSNIFESSFKTVTFNMYPIYLRLGWSYKF